METKESVFDGVEQTPTLGDIRRTRTRSVGRPPSQVFIKDLKINSREFDDDVSQDKSDKNDDISPDSLSPTRTSPKKSDITIEDEVDSAQSLSKLRSYTSELTEILTRKMTNDLASSPSISTESSKQKEVPPWLQELRQRKEHKQSLRDSHKISVEDGTIRIITTENVSETETKTQVASKETKFLNQVNQFQSITEKKTETNLTGVQKFRGLENTDIHKMMNCEPVNVNSVDEKKTILGSLVKTETTTKIELSENVKVIDDKIASSTKEEKTELHTCTTNKKNGESKVENLRCSLRMFEKSCNSQLKRMRNDLKTIQMNINKQIEDINLFLDSFQENEVIDNYQDKK